MTLKVGAVLLDTRSIQKYVFASNELKTNVGASYIVDQIFQDLMCNKVLPKLEKNSVFASLELDWENNREIKLNALTDGCEVAYVGGGNMLLIYNKPCATEDEMLELGKTTVRAWSKELLYYAPGLKTGAAVGFVDLEQTENYQQLIHDLMDQLKKNQSLILPEVDLPYTGLTKECDISGKTADAYDYSTGEKRMVSSEVKAKIEAYKDAKKHLSDKYYDILRGEFDFVEDSGMLGYLEGESYICVTHIDGNNMGKVFSECTSLEQRKAKSMEVNKAVDKAFRALLNSIIAEYASYAGYLNMEMLNKGEVSLLPIRPIIIGGDDITFITPGRLGLEYTKRFMEEIKKTGVMSCCAGVAIVPAKYPFFRAYEMAEQLCSEAKACSRKHNDCWLDFAILHGEATPELEQLLRQEYTGVMGALHYGPYKVDELCAGQELAKGKGLVELLKLSKALDDKAIADTIMDKLQRKAARNKVKKLREVLTSDKHAQVRFLELSEELQTLLKKQTSKDVVTADDFWEKVDGAMATRYIDAIEILDFVPAAKKVKK